MPSSGRLLQSANSSKVTFAGPPHFGSKLTSHGPPTACDGGSDALASMAELMVGVVLPLLLRSELAVVSLGEKPQQNQSRFCLRSTNSKPTLLSAVRVDAAGARTGRTQSGQSNARSAAAAKVGLRFGVGSAGQEVRCRGVSLERLWGGRNSSDLLLVQLF